MKTKKEVHMFGVTIPKGYPVTDTTDSCACIAYYGEGCLFTREKGEIGYMKPAPGFPIAVNRNDCE